MKWFETKLGAFVVILLLPVVVSAAPFCWDEGGGFGNILVLSIAQSDGNRFSLYGHRFGPGFVCQGMSKLPVTAEATVVGNQVVLGMQVHAVETGKCAASRRLVILDLASLSGTGSFRNDVGTEGPITLTLMMTCPAGALSPTSNGDGDADDIENHPQR